MRLALSVPTLCAICRCWAASRVCLACVVRFSGDVNRCRRCALRVPDGVVQCLGCIRLPPNFDAALAAVDYAFPWSGLVAALKFNDALDLTDALTSLLQKAQARRGLPLPELLLPVPLSAERLRSRGFNQAWEIARRLAARLKRPGDATLLLRVRDTGHQLSVPASLRRSNVDGAFAVEPLRRRELEGRSIALIDDVMTTGATMSELARVARQAGAASVQAWVLARTPAP